MAYKFTLHRESLKRRLAVYVVIAKGPTDIKIYVGKTGDNRDGCNPIISRCGNHFSYNKIHSQVRNKIPDYEHREYTYVFDHFDEYTEDPRQRREAIERINEIERCLNEKLQSKLANARSCTILNPFSGKAYVSGPERLARLRFRTDEVQAKIDEIVKEVQSEISSSFCLEK